tara:strand:+ start:126 stop:437 length:312 start_codon:yes stop_codon:yes gene_type:complete
MSATINWVVKCLDRTYEDGIVYTVHWCATASQDGYIASTYGTFNLNKPEEGDEIIPYEDLTEEIVLSWLFENPDFDKEGMEKGLQEKIDQQITPVVGSGLPWD